MTGAMMKRQLMTTVTHSGWVKRYEKWLLKLKRVDKRRENLSHLWVHLMSVEAVHLQSTCSLKRPHAGTCTACLVTTQWRWLWLSGWPVLQQTACLKLRTESKEQYGWECKNVMCNVRCGPLAPRNTHTSCIHRHFRQVDRAALPITILVLSFWLLQILASQILDKKMETERRSS